MTEWHGHKVMGRLCANALLLELNATVTVMGNLCFRAQNQKSQLICSEQSRKGRVAHALTFLCVFIRFESVYSKNAGELGTICHACDNHPNHC